MTQDKINNRISARDYLSYLKMIGFCIFLLFTSQQAIQAQTIEFEKKKKLPKGVYAMSSTYEGQKAYLIGGVSISNSKRNQVFVYNVGIDKWLDLTDSFEFFKNGGISSALYLPNFDNILITGNSVVKDSIKTIVVSYDLNSFRSSVLAINPFNHYLQSSVTYKNKVYFFGGHVPYQNSTMYASSANSFYALNPVDLKFEILPKMPFYGATQGAVINDKLFTAGGDKMLSSSEGPASKVERSQSVYFYDFKQNSWNQFIDLPFPFVNSTIAAYQSYLFIIGDKSERNQLIIVDTNSGHFKLFDTNLNTIESAAAILNDELHVMGGWDGDSPTRRHFAIACEDLVKLMKE